MLKTTKAEFQNNGKIRFTTTMEFDITDFVALELPESCYACPSGYSSVKGCSCGRNVPFTDEDRKHRPSTCKLMTLEEYLKRAQ